MSSSNDTTELMALVNHYARAIDRCEPDVLREILTDDVVLVGPGFAVNGIEEACAVPAGLREQFRATRHVVHNQCVTFDGNTAQGETYSTASHIHHSEASEAQVLVWEVRYQDQFKLEAGRWRISRRDLLIDWTETRPILLSE
tara:strand:- start:2834 stop:3262 length:429 start_codon:yes stop_codon:yes gene_type:complete